jgi:hypothetical protein
VEREGITAAITLSSSPLTIDGSLVVLIALAPMPGPPKTSKIVRWLGCPAVPAQDFFAASVRLMPRRTEGAGA